MALIENFANLPSVHGCRKKMQANSEISCHHSCPYFGTTWTFWLVPRPTSFLGFGFNKMQSEKTISSGNTCADGTIPHEIPKRIPPCRLAISAYPSCGWISKAAQQTACWWLLMYEAFFKRWPFICGSWAAWKSVPSCQRSDRLTIPASLTSTLSVLAQMIE